ncbi:MFS general substrate transporter [Tothia fuscella]|uniref:MFS general substrate transporter n=1 Tax=Tothia fuscella TaxID=1048955 RepID=A0A9P4P497_9PEZI|nr:MFS general substrate transporter [Tothia fuscella]
MTGSESPTQPLQVEEAVEEVDSEDDFPEGGLRAWLVVVSAFITLLPSFGFMVAIGTLQDYWSQHQLSEYTSRDVGWIPSVFVYLCLALGIWVGPLFDRYGPHYLSVGGSVGYILMMFLLAECKHYYQLLLCCGFLGGITGAFLTTTSLAVVAHWFKAKRGLAQGIAMSGSSCGGLTIPLILRATLPKYGYAWSTRILGFFFLFLLIVGNILMKARIPPSSAAKSKSIITPSMFLDLRFSLLTISVFGLELVLFGSLGIFPTYATSISAYPPDTGFYIISVMNGVSCIGRLIPGYASDRIGRFNTLWIAIVFTLVAMLVLWLPFGDRSLTILYVFSGIFGFGTGSWMALVPACVGQLCRAEEFGRYYGTMYFVGSLSSLVCIPISGQLVQVAGPKFLVGFYCVVLAFTLVTFTFSRWACLGWKWSWTAKI